MDFYSDCRKRRNANARKKKKSASEKKKLSAVWSVKRALVS